MLAAGLSEVGLAAAAAADDWGDVANPVAGAEARSTRSRETPATRTTLSFAFRGREETALGLVFLRIWSMSCRIKLALRLALRQR